MPSVTASPHSEAIWLTHRPQLFWGVMLLALMGLYLFPAYVAPLFDMDEGAYAAVSREMFLSGEWWATRLNGELFFHKPVWMYWLQSIGLWFFGEGRFAYRASSLIAFALWLWFSYRFIRVHLDSLTAELFVWLSVFSAGTLVIFKAAIPDAWLILFISLAMFQAWRYLLEGDMNALYWAFFWTGMGLLVKGPIAFVVVGGSLLFYLLLHKDWARLATTLLAWRGWLIMLAVALPWYGLQWFMFGQAFIDEFFGVHNVGRFMNPMEGHSGSPTYYVGVLLFLSLPFLPLLLRAFASFSTWSKANSLWWFLAIWFVLVFVFFTIAATKLPHYLMYGMPPILLAMAYLARQKGSRWGLGATVFFVSVVLLAVPWLIEQAMQIERNAYLKETFSPAVALVPSTYFVWLGFSAMIGLLLWIKRFAITQQIVLAGGAMAVAINFSVLHFAAILQQQPVVEAADFVKHNQIAVDKGAFLLPSFNVEAQQISPVTQAKSGDIVFDKRSVLASDYAEVEWLWQGRGVAIVKVIRE